MHGLSLRRCGSSTPIKRLNPHKTACVRPCCTQIQQPAAARRPRHRRARLRLKPEPPLVRGICSLAPRHISIVYIHVERWHVGQLRSSPVRLPRARAQPAQLPATASRARRRRLLRPRPHTYRRPRICISRRAALPVFVLAYGCQALPAVMYSLASGCHRTCVILQREQRRVQGTADAISTQKAIQSEECHPDTRVNMLDRFPRRFSVQVSVEEVTKPQHRRLPLGNPHGPRHPEAKATTRNEQVYAKRKAPPLGAPAGGARAYMFWRAREAPASPTGEPPTALLVCRFCSRARGRGRQPAQAPRLGPTKQVPATQSRVTWRHRACPGQIALFLNFFPRFANLAV